MQQKQGEEINLPDGYTRYKCLQSNGVDKIITPIKVQGEMSLRADMQFIGNGALNLRYIGGGNANWNRIELKNDFMSGTRNITIARTGAELYLNRIVDGRGIYIARGSVSMQKAVGEIYYTDGTLKQHLEKTGRTLYDLGNFNIECCQADLTKYYRMTVYGDFDSTIKLFDGIPCRRDSDGVYGLYDLISETFYASENNEIIGNNDYI